MSPGRTVCTVWAGLFLADLPGDRNIDQLIGVGVLSAVPFPPLCERGPFAGSEPCHRSHPALPSWRHCYHCPWARLLRKGDRAAGGAEAGIPFYYKEMTALAAQESGLDREFISGVNRNAPQALHNLYLSTKVVRMAVVAQH